MPAKKTAPKTFFVARKSGTKGSILKDVRPIVSNTTGEQNYVLVFEDADVVMPGSWAIREQDFPAGIYEGMLLAAYWDNDNRFHMYIPE